MSNLAAVILSASSKGGCAKSTSVLILAGEYAAQGYRVHIVDADPRMRCLKWAGEDPVSMQAKVEAAKRGEAIPPRRLPASISLSYAGDARSVKVEVEKAREFAEVVLIDVEGTPNAVLSFAIQLASFVVIPATKNIPDVEDAIATAGLVKDSGMMANRVIPFGVLWSIVPPSAVRSREQLAAERDLAEAGLPVISEVFQRSAFSALHSFGTTLDELPPSEVPGIEKAKADAVRLTDAIALMMASGTQNTSSDEAAA